MVQFTREDPVKTSDTKNMPDWTRVSEGYTSTSSAVGKSLTNAGNTIKEGAVMLEQKFGEYVTERAKDTAALAEINLLNIDQGRFHPDLLRELNTLKDRKDASEAGGVSTESFNLHLLAKTKELKNRFPTFQDEVDAGLRSMGYTPAQDVLRDRQREIDRARSAADDVAKRDASFMEWATKQDPMSLLSWQNSGMKDGVNGLRAKVAANGVRKQMLELNTLEITNKMKNNELGKVDAERSFQAQSAYVFDEAVNSLTGEYKSVNENLKKYTTSLASGGEPDKASLDMGRIQFQEMKRKTLENTMLMIQNNPAYRMYPAEAQKAVEDVTKRLDTFGEVIFGKDYNKGSLIAALADNAVDAKNYKFANDPNIVATSNAKEWLGEERYKEWAAKNPNIVEAADRARIGDEMARVQWTDSKIGTVKQAYELMAEEGVKDPAAYKTLLTDMTDSFLHEKVPTQTKARIASYLFSPQNEGFMNSLTPESQVQVFGALHDKKMYKEVEKLVAATGQTDYMKNYRKNLAKSWVEVNEKNVETLTNFHVFGKGGTLKINPSDLTVVETPVRNADGSRGQITLSSSERAAINTVNRTLRPIIDIFNEAKVPKTQQIESIVTMLAQAGLDLTRNKETTMLDRFQQYGKSGGFVSGLVNPENKGAMRGRAPDGPTTMKLPGRVTDVRDE